MMWIGKRNNNNDRVLRNDEKLTIWATAAGEATKAIQGPEHPIDGDFNNKLDVLKAEFHRVHKA
jgi:hypothetical protein